MSSRIEHERRQYDPYPGGWLGVVRVILNTSGPVALMAIGLTAFMAWGVWGRLERIERNQHEILTAIHDAQVRMGSYVAASNEMNREQAALLEKLVRLARQQCINAAERDSQARLCSD